jgi:hypothetical protein
MQNNTIMRRHRETSRQHQFDGAKDQDLRVWWIPQVPLQRGHFT